MHNQKSLVVVGTDPQPLGGIDGPGSGTRQVGARNMVSQAAMDRSQDDHAAVLTALQSAQPSSAPITPPTQQLQAPARPAEDVGTRRRLEWFKSLLRTAVVPALESLITGTLIAAAPAMLPATAIAIAGKVVLQPTLDWLTGQLVDIAADPKKFTGEAMDAMKTAWNEPGKVVEATKAKVSSMLPTRGGVGRGIRALVIGGSQFAGEMFLKSVSDKLVGYPGIASVMATCAPHFGRVFGTVVDFGIDTLLPMVFVDPADLPGTGSIVKVCTILPARVVDAKERLDGYWDVVVAFDATALDWLTIGGGATLKLGPEKRIADISKPTDLAMSFGKPAAYTISALETKAYGEHEGWSLTGKIAATGPSPHGPATLDRLNVSPMGWVDGAFQVANQVGKLGGTAPNGVQAPPPPPRESRAVIPRSVRFPDEDQMEPEREPAPRPKAQIEAPMLDLPALESDDFVIPSGGDQPLAKSIHDALKCEHSQWALSGAMRFMGYLTSYSNLVAQKSARPAPARSPILQAPRDPKQSMVTFFSMLNPSGLLDKISQTSLVPSWLRTSYPRMSFTANDLRIGREPSLTFGMSMGLQLFAAMPNLTLADVVVTWLPFADPPARLRAAEVSFGDNLWTRGLEMDPDGGVRAVAAGVGVPLPLGPFSIGRLSAEADYLTIGHGFDFRNARVNATDLAIAGVIMVKKLGLSVDEKGPDPRLTASIEGGQVLLPDASMQFGGKVSWGAGRPVTGKGAVKGGPLSALGGKIRATSLGGELEVADRAASGKVSATDLVVSWDAYQLKVSGDVSLDRLGLAGFHLPRLEAWKDGKLVGSALEVDYQRGQSLTVGKLALTVPETGPISGEAIDKDKPATLAFTNLDLSKAVRPTGAPVTPSGKKPGVAVDNLKILRIGPSGSPFLTLDFTKQGDEPAPPGTTQAEVSGNLRAFQIAPRVVAVGPSATHPEEMRIRIADAGGDDSLGTLTYDAGILTVEKARKKIDALIGALTPEALKGLSSAVDVSFEIDTRAGTLKKLSMGGALSGTLFGGALEIQSAIARLAATPGAIPATSLTDGMTLTGDIDVKNVVVTAFGKRLEVRGSITFPAGTAKLDGELITERSTVKVVGAQGANGKLTFESMSAELALPSTDLVKFVASPSAILKLPVQDQGKVVVIAKRVKVAPDGQSESAASEQVSHVPSAEPAQAKKPDAPSPPKVPVDPSASAAQAQAERLRLFVHLPTINVGDGALTVTAADVDLDPHGPQTVAAVATLAMGPLTGSVSGSVTMDVPRHDAAREPEQPKVAAPDHRSLSVDVTQATLGGIALTGVTFAKDKLKIAKAVAPLGTLLAKLPVDLGLTDTECTLEGLEIDAPKRSLTFTSFGVGAKKLAFLGDSLTFESLSASLGGGPIPLQGDKLVPGAWVLTLAATGANMQLTETLSVGGSGTLVLLPTGFKSGSLEGAKVKGAAGEAGVAEATLLPKGWSLKGLYLDVAPGAMLGDLAMATQLPPWMVPGDLGLRMRATLDVSHDGKKVVWPPLSSVKLDVRAGGLKLPGGITGWFDRDKKRAGITAKPPKSEFSVTTQIPFAQGVGIEIGGSLAYQVGLAGEVDLAPGDGIELAGALEASATLSGRVRVGIFGGVPYLFTVSAGVFAGMDLDAKIKAQASGRWSTRKSDGETPSGDMQLYVKFAGSDGSPASLKGVAGAYAAIKVLGYYKTIEKPLAQKALAEIDAHGLMSLGTETGVRFLPQGAFPAHVVRLDPALERLLLGGDTEDALKEAQRNVDRGVAKVQASEELLDGAKGAKPGDKPWASQQGDLAAAALVADATVVADRAAVTEASDALTGDRKSLATARDKLALYQTKMKRFLELEAKPKSIDAVDKARGFSIVDGHVMLSGRSAIAGDVAARLADYANTQGLKLEKKHPLDKAALQLKIDYKQAEIVELDARIAKDAAGKSKAQLKTAVDTDAGTKAQRKADLAKGTVKEATDDHIRRQERLLQLHAKLTAAHDKAHQQSSKRGDKKKQLAAEETRARDELKLLKAREGAPATEIQFWDEHIKFLVAEQKRLTKQEEIPPLVLSPDAAREIARAERERGKKARALDGKTSAKLEEVEREIEKLTLGLSSNFQDLAKLADDVSTEAARKQLELDRKGLLLDLDEAQSKLAKLFAEASA